jgi:hypothetical protein
MTEKIHEGDLNSNERGTCARTNGGKIKFSSLPLNLLAGTARVLMFGAKKYAPWNWAKGGDWSTPFDCTMRHLIKFWYFGESHDKESGLHHIDHAICNLLFLRHCIDTWGSGDDRPPQESTGFHFTLDEFNEKMEDLS